MTEPPLVSDIETLRRINLQLVDWELQGPNAPRDQVAEVLDDRFLFRRAKGNVDREGFLAGLANPKNQSRELEARIGQIQVLGDQAFVEVFVFLDGLRDGGPVKGGSGISASGRSNPTAVGAACSGSISHSLHDRAFRRHCSCFFSKNKVTSL